MTVELTHTPLTPKSLEELIAQLPATERARIRWMPRSVAAEIERLFQALELTDELTASVTHSFLSAIKPLARLIARPSICGLVETKLQELGHRAAEMLQRVPVEGRRAAGRSVATVMVVGGLGAHLLSTIDQAQLEDVVGELDSAETIDLHDPDGRMLRAQVLASAVLHAIETERAAHPRTLELARLADQDALAWSEALRARVPDNLQVRLPWYDASAPRAHKFEAVALWAEPRTTRNDRAVALLENWSRAGNADEDRDSWERLRTAVDDDRSSNRPLFP